MSCISFVQRSVFQEIPRVLALLNKNPYSHAFGSLDRKYWQYKILDFPCGMQQELVLPLGYVWKTFTKDNPYYQNERLEQLIKGIFLFHGKACHSDGSLDDYFPHERAYGATAYALAALSETALLTGLCPQKDSVSLEKSADFLVKYRESGKLSNHLAIASAALANMAELTNNSSWQKHSDSIARELQQQQNDEGWFSEYGGCDLGYQTVTIEFLARKQQRAPCDSLDETLSKALGFLRQFLHPDGSLGGEYCSRNTYNFYPGGMAILSPKYAEAAELLGGYFMGIEKGTANHLVDDGVFGHMLSSRIMLLVNSETMRILQPTRRTGPRQIVSFPGAGLFIASQGNISCFGSLEKGGVYKLFLEDQLVRSDTGFMGRLANGQIFCQNNPLSATGTVQDASIEIHGQFQKYRNNRLTRMQMIALRLLSMTIGWLPFYSNLIRTLMQKVLISGDRNLPLFFTRRIDFTPNSVKIEDEIINRGINPIVKMHRAPDCVNMHVITSDSFQTVNLQPWQEVQLSADADSMRFTVEHQDGS